MIDALVPVRKRPGVARACAIVAVAGILVAAATRPRAAAPLAVPPSAESQSANTSAFEVASVKKNESNTDAQSTRLQPGGRLVMTNQPLRRLILFAYGLQPQQLAGGPDWLDSDRFDIVAQAGGNIPPSPPGGPPGPAQLMLQRLLAERFKLAVHTETRELPIYALTLTRSDGQLGPRIRPSKTDCASLLTGRAGGAPPALPRLPDGRPACGIGSGGAGRMLAGGTTMAMLATLVLSGPAGRMVVDRTDLPGGYDFDLEFTPDPLGSPAGVARDAPPPATDDRPSLFTAIEEQLGLKLQPQRAPVDVLVIDRVEPPTKN